MGDRAALGDSSMRILWQLIKGGLAGLVLLAGCWLVFRKRAGIVLLHGGIRLVMANELVVYGLHDEGQMQIVEGQTINYAYDIRTIELAVVDPSDPRTTTSWSCREWMLEEKKQIRRQAIALRCRSGASICKTRHWSKPKEGEKNPATAGIGLHSWPSRGAQAPAPTPAARST